MTASFRSRVFLAILAFAASLLSQSTFASAETRVLKFYHLHTHERATIAYKRDGRYLPDGLKQINHILRDWRENKEVKINPRLLDLVWQAYRLSGSRDYINVICGYRAPETNSMLRRRSSGVAKTSQHMRGNALDFYLPDVPLSKLRAVGLKLQDGGVGYYPTSGSPFVHMDVGNVRHWPRMSRSQLLALFPDGKTVHIPSDGKPLAGYNVALASYKSRVDNGQILMASNTSSGGSKRGFLASLFSGGADEEEDRSGVDDVPAKATARAAVAVARAPQAEQAPAVPAPATILAALPERSVPVPRIAPRPDAEVGPTEQATLVAVASDTDDAVAESARAKLAALNVPVPTSRPDYRPEPQVKPTLVADAGMGEVSETSRLPAPEAAFEEILRANPRPETPSSAVAYLPVPGERPSYEIADSDQSPKSLAISSAAEKFAETLTIEQGADSGKSSRTSASPRLAMLSGTGSEGSRPDFFAGVKTTKKAARVRSAGRKQARRSVEVPVNVEVARWAVSEKPAEHEVEQAGLPRFDAGLVKSPAAVYTAGFTNEVNVADASRFSGNAVKFMSVARFASN